MSAIAEVLAALGHVVSGSDRRDGAVLDRLRLHGIDARVPHDPANVREVEVVAASTAIGQDNPELVAARERGLEVLHRFDLLAAIGSLRRTVSIAGTHGKTTTSALTALALDSAGLDPSFIIGGDVAGFGSGSRWHDSEWLVLEADESDSTFLAPPRAAAVITNIEADHLDHHGTLAALMDAFGRFVTGTDGPVVVCLDDPGVRDLLAGLTSSAAVTSYGLSPAADFRIVDVTPGHEGVSWSVESPDGERSRLSLCRPGLHLVRNATAAFAVARRIGAELGGVIEGLARYRGVGRRFEHRGTARGVEFVDDYAHMPTEVRAVLEAVTSANGADVASRRWKRVVAVFQPHRFSRTQAIGAEFATAFDGSDIVVITDVYAAGETAIEGVSGRLLFDAIVAARPRQQIRWAPTRSELIVMLDELLTDGDLCLTMGAGDLTSLPDDLLAVMR